MNETEAFRGGAETGRATVLGRALPKWPALVVVGEPVTREQAMEILVRTDGLCFGTNDREWERALYGVLGIGPERMDSGREWWPNFAEHRRVCEELGVLSLSYLENRRIASAWINGPHGWCDWSGRIGSDNYNIGKWPSVEAVRDDWRKIAAAFPYLTLRSQLFNGEVGEEGAKPVVEFVVSGGRVKTRAPRAPLALPQSTFDATSFAVSLLRRDRERGCTLQTLEQAVALIRAAASPQTAPPE